MSDVPDSFPTQAARFSLPGPAGHIECAGDAPAPDSARLGVAIVCHPNPAQGGTMDNKVVTTLERALRELGLATVRFNFRGVGASTGTFDDGEGETDDALAVVDWAQRVLPRHQVWLAGFSFGGFVAARVAGRRNVRHLVTVAPAVTRLDFATMPAPACPWLIVQGEADEVIDPAAVYAFSAAFAPPPTLARMSEATHFFHRRLIELREIVQRHLRDALPPPANA